jgi:hypothetical protein
MGALTIQILILVSSFLFYRILRSGFDSWTSIVVDFGIVLFLFGLQYFIQKQQQSNGEDPSFPSSQISSFFNASFPSKIAFDSKGNNSNSDLSYPISPRPLYANHMVLNENLFFEPLERKELVFFNKISNQMDQKILNVPEDGFYILQINCITDVVPFYAKINIRGKLNDLDKTIHQGENSFVIHLKGKDQISIDLENQNQKVMMLEDTEIYFIKL